jgi:hypothetical protein
MASNIQPDYPSPYPAGFATFQCGIWVCKVGEELKRLVAALPVSALKNRWEWFLIAGGAAPPVGFSTVCLLVTAGDSVTLNPGCVVGESVTIANSQTLAVGLMVPAGESIP